MHKANAIVFKRKCPKGELTEAKQSDRVLVKIWTTIFIQLTLPLLQLDLFVKFEGASDEGSGISYVKIRPLNTDVFRQSDELS